MKLEMMARSSSADANKQRLGREAKRKALIPEDPSAAPHTQCVYGCKMSGKESGVELGCSQ